eukprot:347552_1
MKRYIPPSRRRPYTITLPTTHSITTINEDTQNVPLTLNSKRKFKYNVLHNLNIQIEANIKYNNYLNGTLTDKLYINTALSPDETPHEHPKETSSFADPNTPILAPKTIPYDYNNIDNEDENLSYQNDEK